MRENQPARDKWLPASGLNYSMKIILHLILLTAAQTRSEPRNPRTP